MRHKSNWEIWPRFLSLSGLWLILAAFIFLAWAYGLVLPPFENLDEIEHFSAIRYVADTGSLPVHDPLLQERYRYRQEASQPPLYYILMSGLTRLLGLSTGDTNDYLVSNPFVACGPSDNPYNKNALYHNPSQEAFSLAKIGTPPLDGALLTLHILRALTPLLQVVTIVGVYAIARLIIPRYPQVALLAAALTAFNPQFLSVASGINNDNLITPLATCGLYLALITRQQGLSLGRSLGLGALAGLAALSKLTGLLLLGLAGFVLLEVAWRTGRWRRSISHGLLMGATATAVCGWWFLRNWQLYGDPTALEPMFDLVGRRASSTLPLNESGLMFRSFWGQLACAFYGNWFYLFFGLLTAMGLTGLIVSLLVSSSRGRAGEGERQAWTGLLYLVLWFGLVFVGWLRWGSITAATGGRLLFPAIASTLILLAYGLLRLWPAAWRGRIAAGVSILLAVVALATLLWEICPLFAPPRVYTEANAPTISHSLEATFDAASQGDASQIDLLGYDAEIQGGSPYLDITTYWQALGPVSRDYVLAIQLTSPVPGDDTLRFNYNTWPGRGNYPTTAWVPGQIIADNYRFRLPANTALTQAWHLLVAFYEIESGDRLPVQLYGQDVGSALVLTTLRVSGLSSVCPEETTLDGPVHFGDGELEMISLSGATAKYYVKGEPRIEASLCWKALAPIPLDYTVFVHLYDEQGELVATGDGPPMNGAFPTLLWQHGDVIADAHLIPGLLIWPPGNTDSYRIGVGLYDPISGERLQAIQAGQPLPDNVVLIKFYE
jgi:4-amino-4-deoxy-L-arabinose transferase-like glycosyltransferase